MLDPLTAAGLAGNIITFVDFSSKALAKGKQLYDSASGATKENEEVEALTRNLKDLAQNIQKRPKEVSIGGRSRLNLSSAGILDNLSQQCIQVADELLEALESIKVSGDGRLRKSAVQAVKTLWKQDHVEGLQRRLDRIANQLMEGMNIDQLEEINRRLRDMAVENTRLEANRSKEIEALRQDFNSAIQDLKTSCEHEQSPAAWLVLADSARRGQAFFAEQVILQCLRFSSIDSRHEAISKEHEHTFSWIFSNQYSIRFVEWLRQDDGVFWVSGKPGSGKSTLLKCVASHDKTRAHLEEWAGDKRLVTASFFFWNASTHESQKTQRGLLRTLIYQILRQCPELIQEAYQDQWIAMTSDGAVLQESRDELLTVPALLRTLKTISNTTNSSTKFCFFIDGLDEYNGRPADIIELIRILKSIPNVKTCISSRPWNDFEDRFGGDASRKIYIHEYTREDIRRYVQETLGEHPRAKQLIREDPECPHFVSDIVNRADGVFLWVHLVVQSLLDGLTNSDRVKDLQARLDETPNDLKAYFQTILFSTENRYRKQTAQMFTIAVNAWVELPLMAYWVLDQENPKYAIECSSVPPDLSVALARFDNMKRRLRVLCKGLLDIQEEPTEEDAYSTSEGGDVEEDVGLIFFKYPVHFLHRTVKDYLQTPEAQSMLQSWAGEGFNTDYEIANSITALVKWSPQLSFRDQHPIMEQLMMFFVGYASRLDSVPERRGDLQDLLDILQSRFEAAWEYNKGALGEDWHDSGIIRGKESLEKPLLATYACFLGGLQNTASEMLEKDTQLAQRLNNGIHFLNVLFHFITGIMDDSDPHPIFDSNKSFEVLLMLLEHGLDVNFTQQGKSDWQLLVNEMDKGIQERGKRPRDFEVIRALVQYGADLDVVCKYEGIYYRDGVRKRLERDCTARKIMKTWFDDDQFAVLEYLGQKRIAKKKKGEKISTKIRQLRIWVQSKR